MTAAAAAVAAALLASCGEHGTDRVVTEFPMTETLSADTFHLDNAELVSAMVGAAGDYLLFADQGGNHNFSVYNDRLEFVDTIVRRGAGPDELTAAMYFGQWRGAAATPEVYALSPEKQRMVKFGVDTFAGLTTALELPQEEYLNPNFVYLVSDTLTVGLKMDPTAAVAIFTYNPTTGRIGVHDDTFTYNENNRFYVSQKSLAADKEGRGYVTAYFNMPWIVVRDSRFNVTRRIAIGQAVDPTTITDDFGDGGSGFTAVSYYGDHILALFNERGEEPRSRLLVFSTQGEPEAEFDMGSAMWFTVDSHDRLIATHYDAARDEICVTASPLPASLKHL